MSELEPLWDMQDVANYLRVSRATVKRLLKAGRLPKLKVGHHVRFKPDAVKALEWGEH